ncbi:MAG: radical SAM family heme chaperone HemW [Anaerovoracaceae bacterium]
MMKTSNPAVAAHAARPGKKPLGLYLHIPFCLQKCGYCDFYSEAGLSDDLKKAYVQALCREIGAYGRQLSPEHTVDTVFLGGGTPSILPSHLTKSILSAVFDEFDVSADAEVSMECNPATLTEEKLGVYREAGINRLSLGVQSMDDGLLQVMGRVHSRQDVMETVELARKAGFDNLNLDLMFGIPGQSRKMWEETVRTVFAMNPEHLSFYSLELAEGTPFYRQVARGILQPTPQEEDRQMYHFLLRELQERGYDHYEISNSALPGYRCRHNLKYWDLSDYLGLGASAHSFLQGRRFASVSDVRAYVQAVENGESPASWQHENSRQDSITDYTFTALRRREGIGKTDFAKRFGEEFWDVFSGREEEFRQFTQRGEAEEDEAGIRITEAGMDIANRIIEIFL